MSYDLPDDTLLQPAPKRKEMSKAQIYIFVACLMIPTLGFAVFMAIRQNRMEAAEEDAFAAEMDQLLQPPKQGTPPEGKPGRFAEINVDTRALYSADGLHGRLPDDMRATTPDEADYIVHVHEIREPVAEYLNGAQGIKLTLELTVIDKPTWTVMGRKTIVGEDPPLVTIGSDPGDDVVGAIDHDAVEAFYRSIARMN